MPWWVYVGAYLVACVGGGFAVGCCLYGMRHLVLKKENRPPFAEWHVFFVGATERAVALTPVLLAPPYLGSFVGAWVVLKFALGWQRAQQIADKAGKEEDKEVGKGSLLALIGNVLSFAIAIAIGAYLNPKALDVWAATTH
jgi:hypothetical protein